MRPTCLFPPTVRKEHDPAPKLTSSPSLPYSRAWKGCRRWEKRQVTTLDARMVQHLKENLNNDEDSKIKSD